MKLTEALEKVKEGKRVEADGTILFGEAHILYCQEKSNPLESRTRPNLLAEGWWEKDWQIVEEESELYDHCPICGWNWKEHDDIKCCKKNFMSYVKGTDKSKLNIMADSFDKVIISAKKQVFDDLDEQIAKLCKSAGIPNEEEPYKDLKKKHLNHN